MTKGIQKVFFVGSVVCSNSLFLFIGGNLLVTMTYCIRVCLDQGFVGDLFQIFQSPLP